MAVPGFYTLRRHALAKANYMPVGHMPNYGPSVTGIPGSVTAVAYIIHSVRRFGNLRILASFWKVVSSLAVGF